ncbi:MAG: hypothetical protein WBW03_28900 [Silvibacterium sp.]
MSPHAQYSDPFPGLRPFEFDETALFFGRDGQSDEVLRRLRLQRFLAIIGTSGSGKSSLIRAGVLPAIYGGMMVQVGSRWRHAIFRPGDDPIGNLSCALSREGVLASGVSHDEALDTALIESTLRSSGVGLIDVTRLAHLPPRENLLVIVDQFEELIRFANAAQSARRENDAAAFVKLLLEATSQTAFPIYVIITMRSDFIGDCARFRDLAEAVNDGMYLIPRMTRDQRKEAICGPVAVGGAEIAPRLVNRLLNDVGDNPDQLPIMQHALMRTWDLWKRDHQNGEPLDLRHYEAIGGIAEALSRHAEEAYAELPDDRHREIAKRLFQSLTEKGGDNREVRRPTRISEILERTHEDLDSILVTVESFRRPGRSFLMPPSDVPLTEQSVVDISHESLIRGWERLRDWVQDESTSAETYRRLAETAAYHAQDKAGFLTNPELSVALAWRKREQPTSAWARRYRGDFGQAMRFLEDSRQAYEAERTERERKRVMELHRLQVFAVVVLFAFIVAALLGVYSWRQRRELEKDQASLKLQNSVIEKQKNDVVGMNASLVEARNKAVQALNVANEKTVEAEAEKREADRQRAAAEAEKQQAELSASELGEEVLASRRKVTGDQQTIESLAEQLTGQSSDLYGIQGLQQKQLALTQTGNHQASIEQLNRILEIQPDNISALANRGYEFLLVDEPEKSIIDLRKYLKENPQSSGAFQNLAIDEAMIEQYAAAKQDIRNAIDTYNPAQEGMFESAVSPEIHLATGYTLLAEPGPAYLTALYYEIAAIDAISGDPKFLSDLQKADAKAAEYPHSVAPYFIALDWAWFVSRHVHDPSQPGKDVYGLAAFSGAMWENLAVNHPQWRSYPSIKYCLFEAQDEKYHYDRYRELARWVHQHDFRCNKGNEKTPDEKVAELHEEADEQLATIGDSSDPMQLSAVKKILDTALKNLANNPESSLHRDERVQMLVERARVENDTKDLASMRSDCKEALQLDPHNAAAEYFLALHETNNEIKVRELRAALADDPLDASIIVANINYLYSKGDDVSLAEALELARRRLRVQPFAQSAHRDVATLELKLHHNNKALEAINTLLAISPEVAVYYEDRRTIEAAMEERKAIADLHLAAGYLTAAHALVFLDKQDEALAQYVQALNAAASLPDQSNDDVRFLVEVTARGITDFLSTRFSPEEALRFWQAAAASTKNPTIARWANKELEGLKPRQRSGN